MTLPKINLNSKEDLAFIDYVWSFYGTDDPVYPIQGLTKGMTGSFGLKLQKIAGEFTHETPREGFHLRIKKGERKYRFQNKRFWF